MSDTIKSVVSVASLPRPIHHLQIDLIEGEWGIIVCFCRFLHCAIFFSALFSSLTPHVLSSYPGHVYILFSARDNFIPHV